MTYLAAKGTKDILPPESAVYRLLEQSFAQVCRSFGYSEIRTPTFESTELFQRGVGDSSDVVRKEMYCFSDKAGRNLSLRPEGTAGVVRSFIEHGLDSAPSPLKLFYQINAFRYEKMQKGRFREFHQLGCELFGSASAQADAELIALLTVYFRKLGLRELVLHINTLGCATCRPPYISALKQYFAARLTGLCSDCQERYQRNPLRILDCKNPRCQELTATAPQQSDYLCTACASNWSELTTTLTEFALSYTIDPRLVRGLDYYSRTVFEFVSEHVGTQGAICGGGRYDALVELLGGKPCPATGFALGVERLLLELAAQDCLPSFSTAPLLYIACFPPFRLAAAKLAQELRARGQQVEVDLCERSLKAQLKQANRLQAKYLCVIGESEILAACVKIKDMSQGTETEVNLHDIGLWLEERSK